MARKYINISRHLARKYARIFVRGHYLFRQANSFARAKLEENCELRGTDYVQGQISEHIFAPNGGYCLYYPSTLFPNARNFQTWGIYNNYSMSLSWIWSDKITNERVARVGYNHFISNKGKWNNYFSKFSNRVLSPIFFISTILQTSGKRKLGALFSIRRKTPTIGS